MREAYQQQLVTRFGPLLASSVARRELAGCNFTEGCIHCCSSGALCGMGMSEKENIAQVSRRS